MPTFAKFFRNSVLRPWNGNLTGNFQVFQTMSKWLWQFTTNPFGSLLWNLVRENAWARCCKIGIMDLGISYRLLDWTAVIFLLLLLLWVLLRRVSKKNSHNCFYNYAKFSRTLIIFGAEVAKMIEMCKVNLFSTSPNLCQHTTMWNTDAPNCYISQWLFVSDCSPLHHQLDKGHHMIY